MCEMRNISNKSLEDVEMEEYEKKFQKCEEVHFFVSICGRPWCDRIAFKIKERTDAYVIAG